MAVFETVDRDGLARLGRLKTPHGIIETPALLPVVHPDPARQVILPSALAERFGLRALITSAYITWRTPPTREAALANGIHGLLGFDGPIMTDSGAFQQHTYGHVETTPEEILDFQSRIGSDIATVLDVFVEPESALEEASRGVGLTLERAREARSRYAGLLAVPVQGGLYLEQRRRSAEGASQWADVLAVGGVVPLLEQYRFADLVRILAAMRPELAPEAALHLFGTGHPMTFALATLFGVDLFDSSAYHKFARRGSLLFPEGTVALASLRESICRCRLCAEVPLPEVARRPRAERERRIAEHNLLMSSMEVAQIRQAIRDGTLWELVERRVAAHPALVRGLEETLKRPEIFLPTEPESRRSFRITGSASVLRPTVVRFLERLEAFRGGIPRLFPGPRPPLIPSILRYIPEEDRQGRPIQWECDTAIGSVPIELGELYPVGCFVAPEDFSRRSEFAPGPPSGSMSFNPREFDIDRDWSDAWTIRHLRAVLNWAYGSEAADGLVQRGIRPERSRRTGRLRILSLAENRAFVLGNDGIPRPGWFGATALHTLLPFPRLRVTVREDAVEFVREGRSLFTAFAQAADSTLVPGASALLVDGEDHLLAVGRLVLAPHEMTRMRRGVAVRVTSHPRHRIPATDAEESPSSGSPPREDAPSQ